MRNHLIAEVGRIAECDLRVVVLTADLGYSVLDGMIGKMPERCLNVGISEQNMTSVAAGLALEGNEVYTYSIGNFPVMRCLEQIRNCVCYHNANVKIIAVGGGFVYGQLGMSHHATEDLAITRALPNMRVFCPADPVEAVNVARYVHGINGPCYIRLARGGEKNLHDEGETLDVTRLMEIESGDDVAVIATGPVVAEAIEAAGILRDRGVRIGVYNCVSIKPIDVQGIADVAKRYSKIITLEEHNVVGGLGSAVADALVGIASARMPKLVKLGLQDVYTSIVGSQMFLRKYYGLSSGDIVKEVEAR